MKFKEFIGIDISKITFDVRIHNTQESNEFPNNKKGYDRLVKWVEKNTSVERLEIVYIFEHTGLYSHNLSIYLSENQIPFVLVPGLEVKKSLGISRGKNDIVDAKRIANYGFEKRDKLKLYKMPSEELIQLKSLLSLRDRLIKQRTGYKANLKEIKEIFVKTDNKILFETQEKMIKYLSKQINIIDRQMQDIINKDLELKEMYDLITSIKSVGMQTALYIIVYTNAFTKFENVRQFASYIGIAPFENSSGSSVRGRTRVSNLAFKKIKSLMDLCAKSAIVYNNEMKTYYIRRVDEGKSKMSTINIVRNKLLSRIFAVVKRGTPYVDLTKFAA